MPAPRGLPSADVGHRPHVIATGAPSVVTHVTERQYVIALLVMVGLGLALPLIAAAVSSLVVGSLYRSAAVALHYMPTSET
jgi:hypothetical protein